MTRAARRAGMLPRRRSPDPVRRLAAGSWQLVLSLMVAGCAARAPAHPPGELYVTPAIRAQPPPSRADDPNGGAN